MEAFETLSRIEEEHGVLLGTTLSFRTLLTVSAILWSASAVMDFYISRTLWADLLGSYKLAVIPATLRVSMAVITSTLLAEPIFPMWTRRSDSSSDGDGGRSAASRFLIDRMHTRWYFFGAGVILSGILIWLMAILSARRFSLEVASGLVPPDAIYLQWAPVGAVFFEIISGILLLEYITLCLVVIRRRLAARKHKRYLRKARHLSRDVYNGWDVIQQDIERCQAARTVPPKVTIGPDLGKLLDMRGKTVWDDLIPPSGKIVRNRKREDGAHGAAGKIIRPRSAA